ARGPLKGGGGEVRVAENGRQAVERVRAEGQPLDAVLMDLQMPVLDGIEATREIRRDRALAALPIVAMTAHALAAEKGRCMAAGMNDYVTKPVEPRVLFATL